jgi:hypothetical protein
LAWFFGHITHTHAYAPTRNNDYIDIALAGNSLERTARSFTHGIKYKMGPCLHPAMHTIEHLPLCHPLIMLLLTCQPNKLSGQ